MPAYYTHKYFAQDIFKNIDNLNINQDYYLLFSQSFDILYYNLGNSKKAKEIKKLGHMAHHKNTQSFFINAISIALENNLQDNQYIRSFILGSLTHYILDSSFHPYIFYKTGIFRHDTQTQKYNGKHTELELLLDIYFFNKDHNIKFHKYKHYKEYNNIKNPPLELINYINLVYERSFYKKNIGNYYFKCLNNWRFVTKHVKNSHAKIKKYLYKAVDNLFKSKSNIEYYSYYLKNYNENFLNNEHKIWFNPANKEICSNNNINEMYLAAFNKCIAISNEIIHVLDKKQAISKLLKVIPNISYSTGLNLSLNLVMKYFEY